MLRYKMIDISPIFSITIRFSDKYLAMILVLKNMLRSITIGWMCRKNFMPM
jgi:hypothetical protein